MTSNLSRDDISKEIGMSMYHFHRIFKSLVGESIRDYLTQRRLTEAAQQLLNTNDSIIDIAAQYNYGSQEAFSRAFKSNFGVNPGEYRKVGRPLIIERPPLTHNELIHLQKGLIREPRIVELPEYTIIGIKNPCLMPYDDNELIRVWLQLLPRIPNLVGKSKPLKLIGVYECLPHLGTFYKTQYSFIAGVPVKGTIPVLPQGTIKKCISAAKYAVFTRKNNAISRLEIHRYLFGAWLPSSKYEPAEREVLLMYVGNPTSPEYDICIPIRSKRLD